MKKKQHYECMIVYNHKDALLANIAYEIFKEAGIDTFIDREAEIGTKIDKLIKIAKASDCVLALASKYSVKSEYCISEVAVARKRYIISLDGKIFSGYEKNHIQPQLGDYPLHYMRNAASTIKKEIRILFHEPENSVLSRIGKSGQYGEIDAQIRSEGIQEAIDLILGSCVELRPNSHDWPSVTLKDLTTLQRPYTISQTVKEIIDEKATAKYSGERKFIIHDIQGGLLDNPSIKLHGWWIDPQVVVRAHEVFDIIYNKIGGTIQLFKLSESQIPNFLVVHALLLTKDNYIVLGQRSSTPYYYPRYWSVSFEEQVNESDGNNLLDATMRGLKEELLGSAINKITKDDIRFESIFREFDRTFHRGLQKQVAVLNTGIVALITTKELGINDIYANWREWRDRIYKKKERGTILSPKDRIEFDNIVGLQLSPRVLQEIITSSDFDPTNICIKQNLWMPKEMSLNYLEVNVNERQWHPSAKLRLNCLFRVKYPDDFTEFIDNYRIKRKYKHK